MAVNIVTQNILAAQLETLIDRKAKISRVANRKYEEMFTGKATTEVVIRRTPRVEHQHGTPSSAGSNITETDMTFQSETYALSELEQLNIKVKDEQKLINDFNQEGSVIQQSAYRTAQNHDAFVACLAAREAGTTINDQNAQSITKDTVEALYADMQVALANADVDEATQGLFANPAIMALANQAPMSTGFDKSLKFKETFGDREVYGFMAGRSNNLPVKYTMTIGAAVAADDTITIRVPNAQKVSEGTSPSYDEVVFTAKATPTNPGEFDVAANKGDQQTIINNMINGTGTGDGTDYVELSAADRNILRRSFIDSQTFGTVNTDKTGITARAGTTVLVSFTSGSNTLSAKSVVILGMDPMAVHFAETMKSFKIVGTESNNQAFAANVMWENVYGGKVTLENKARIVAAEVLNGASDSSSS